MRLSPDALLLAAMLPACSCTMSEAEGIAWCLGECHLDIDSDSRPVPSYNEMLQ